MTEKFRPETNLSLGMLDPKQGFAGLEEYVASSGIVPPESPTLAAVKKYTREKGPEYFMTPRGKGLLRRADNVVYDGLNAHFALSEKGIDPKGFYERNMNAANTQVRKPIERYVGASHDNSLGLLNAVSIPPSPGELAQLITANSPKAQTTEPETADPRALHELARQVTLGLVSGELESRSYNAGERLKEVLNWLTIDLFAKKSPQDHMVYALHDNNSNEVNWVSTTGTPLTQEVQQDAHIKAHPQRMRFVDDEIGWVVADGRLKADGVNKAIRSAIVHEEDGKGDTIDPIEDVPDLMGIKFIVEGDASYEGPRVQALIDRVTTILKKRFDLEDSAFRQKDFNKAEKKKSGKFRGTRLMVDFPDRDVPLEVMFHGQNDHLHNEFHIGEERDEQTGKPDGAAHGILDIDKGINVLERYSYSVNPEAPAPETKDFAIPARGIIWADIKRLNFEALELKLREANRVDKETEEIILKSFSAQNEPSTSM